MERASYAPRSIPELYAQTFQLIRRTTARTGLFILLALLPLHILSGILTKRLFLALHSIFASEDAYILGMPEPKPEQLSALVAPAVGPILGLLVVSVFMLIAVTWVSVILVNDSWSILVKEDRPSLPENIRISSKHPFLISTLQTFLLIAMVVFVCIVAIIIAGIMAASFGSDAVASIIVFGISCLILLFLLATLFRLHHVTLESRGPWRGIIASIALFKRYAKRVLAFTIPLFIVLGILYFSIDFFLTGAAQPETLATTSQSDPAAIAAQFQHIAESYTWVTYIVQTVLTTLALLLTINATTVLYRDVRERRGDFDVNEADWMEI